LKYPAVCFLFGTYSIPLLLLVPETKVQNLKLLKIVLLQQIFRTTAYWHERIHFWFWKRKL